MKNKNLGNAENQEDIIAKMNAMANARPQWVDMRQLPNLTEEQKIIFDRYAKEQGELAKQQSKLKENDIL